VRTPETAGLGAESQGGQTQGLCVTRNPHRNRLGCYIGESFARAAMALLLIKLLSHFELNLREEGRTPCHHGSDTNHEASFLSRESHPGISRSDP
jgi:hypothetical protein